jgi:hypothetical protein
VSSAADCKFVVHGTSLHFFGSSDGLTGHAELRTLELSDSVAGATSVASDLPYGTSGDIQLMATDTHFCWPYAPDVNASGRTIGCQLLSGGSWEASVIWSTNFWSYTVAGGDLYVAGQSPQGGLHRTDIDFGDSGVDQVSSGLRGDPTTIVVDDTHVYWGEEVDVTEGIFRRRR